MKTIKRRFEQFLFYDYTGIEAHLEKMAMKGWQIHKITPFYWEYYRIEPQMLTFTVTYFSDASEFNPYPTENQQTFHEYCKAAGWQLVAEHAQMQIFCSEQANPTPIETEESVKLKAIHRAMKKNFMPSNSKHRVAADNKPKCLIIHGFGGGVHEIKAHLIGLDYDVVCPILKGHSTTKKDMKAATYTDWIESAESEFLRLKESGGEVMVLGFSMGGLIAFNLCCKYNLKAIVTINTPIFYWNLAQVIHNLVDDIKNRNVVSIKRYLQAKQNSPISSMKQFLLLLNQTKSKLDKVNCPLLIIQAEDDDTSRIKSVDYIYKHVSSSKKKIKYYNEGGHQILQSPMAVQVFSCVDDFMLTL